MAGALAEPADGAVLVFRCDDSSVAERFAEVAEQAKSACPVSKALAGTSISLEVVAG